MQRESMQYDVVIVGGGPSGLAAAIRLKQLAASAGREVAVCVLEKGSEIGAHILSGAVIDPRALTELLPDWKDRDAPIRTAVTEDRFLLLTAEKAWRIPNWSLPRLMDNHGNYIVSLGNVCRWLGGVAEAMGVEIYPGFAAAEVLYDERRRGDGRRHRRHGDREGRIAQADVPARHGAPRQVHAVRRGRARLAVADADVALQPARRRRPAEVRHRHQGTVGGRSGPPPPGPRDPQPGLAACRTTSAAARSSTTSASGWCRWASSCTSTTPTRTSRRSTSSSASRRTRRSATPSPAASASPTVRARSTRAGCSPCRSSPSPAAR